MALRAFYSRTSCECIGQRMREKEAGHRSHPWSDFAGLLELSSGEAPDIGQCCTYMTWNSLVWFAYGTQGEAFWIGGMHSGCNMPSCGVQPRIWGLGCFCKHSFARGRAGGDSESPEKFTLPRCSLAQTFRAVTSSGFVELTYIGRT